MPTRARGVCAGVGGGGGGGGVWGCGKCAVWGVRVYPPMISARLRHHFLTFHTTPRLFSLFFFLSLPRHSFDAVVRCRYAALG